MVIQPQGVTFPCLSLSLVSMGCDPLEDHPGLSAFPPSYLVNVHPMLSRLQGVRGSPPKATPSQFDSALFVFRDFHLALHAKHHPPAFAQSKTKTIPWQGFSRQNDTHYALKHDGLSLVMRPAVGLIRQSYPAYAVSPATTKLLWQAWYPHSAPYSRTFASLSRDW